LNQWTSGAVKALLIVLPFSHAAAAQAPRAVHDPAKSAAPAPSPSAGAKPRKAAAKPAAELTPLQKALGDLKSTDPSLRRRGAEDLARLRDAHAAPALVVALSDEDASVRAAVARALGLMRSPDGTKELSRVLRDDPDPQVRQSAAVALGFIGDRSAAGALTAALKDHPGVRYAACQALSSLRDPSAVPALSEALKDPEANFRRAAAQSLGEIGDAAAVPALRPLLKDDDIGVRTAAVQSLGKLQDKASASEMKKFLKKGTPVDLRVAAARALALQGNAAGRSTALEVLDDAAAPVPVRLQAAQALAALPDRSLEAPLKKIAEREGDENVKQAVRSLLEGLARNP
jgi:HEAT repeat protein